MNINITELTDHLKIEKIITWTYSGSMLYGLNTESSDTDLFIITEGLARSKQSIRGEMDLRIMSIRNFIKGIYNTSIPEIDILASRKLDFSESSYENFFEQNRFDSYQYFKNSESLALKFLPKITPEIMEIRREYKNLKASLRSIMLAWKMLDQGNDFNPIFSDRERDAYWEFMESFQNRFKNGDSWEDILEDMHNHSRQLRDM